MKRKYFDIFLKLIFILALGILIYPIFESRVIEKRENDKVIADFEKNFEYEKNIQVDKSSLDLSKEKDVIGVIYMPKINLNLPIYYGIDEHALSNGAGTMVEYGLPKGQNNTHSIIISHSGLSSSGLFTNINQLELNDLFYIKTDEGIINKYIVNNIVTVEPTDFSYFTLDQNKSKVTLVTCTPIGINTHRLLVQGELIGQENEITEKGNITFSTYEIIVMLIFSLLLLIYTIYISIKLRKQRKEKVNENN